MIYFFGDGRGKLLTFVDWTKSKHSLHLKCWDLLSEDFRRVAENQDSGPAIVMVTAIN